MSRLRYPWIIVPLLMSSTLVADTIDHFMSIANTIPEMEMKADSQSQAWARSAKTILVLTSESIAETLILANDAIQRQGGKPLFCLPAGTPLNAANLSTMIQQTYRGISSQPSDKDKLTVSQLALMAINKEYPCKETPDK